MDFPPHPGAVVAGMGTLLALLIPAFAAGGGGWRTAVPAVALLAAGFGLCLPAAGPGPALAALLPLAGFALFLAGGVRALVAMGTPRPAATALSALLGCGLLVLPFLGDPLVEPGGPGRSSPVAVEVLLGGSPLAASVGGGLGVDFLRAPRAYGGGAGPGLSRIGAFYASRYPRPAVSGAAFGLAGILLFGASRLASVTSRS